MFLLLLPHITKLENIKMVFEFVRHGARNGISLSEGYTVPEGREGMADLVPNGMREHYNLGKQLARKYKELLSGNPNIKVYVSDPNRTVVSALCQLKGLNIKSPEVETPDQKKFWTPPGLDLTNAVNEQNTSSKKESGSRKKRHRHNRNHHLSRFGYEHLNIVPLTIQPRNKNFMFRPYNHCPNLRKITNENDQQAGTSQYIQLIAPSIKVFKQNGIDLAAILDFQNYTFSELITLLSNKISQIYASPDSKWNYELLFHLELIADYTLLRILDTSNAANGWSFQILQRIVSNAEAFLKGDDFDGLTLFFGHDNSIMGLFGDLLFPKSAENFPKMYKEMQDHFQIENQDDYVNLISKIEQDYGYFVVGYASSILIEIFEGRSFFIEYISRFRNYNPLTEI